MCPQFSREWWRQKGATIRDNIRSLTMPGANLIFIIIGSLSTLAIAGLTAYALFFQIIPRFQLDKTTELLAQTEIQLEESEGRLGVVSKELHDQMQKVTETEAKLHELEQETKDFAIRLFIFNAREALPLGRKNAQLLSSIDENPDVEVNVLESNQDIMLLRVSRGVSPYIVRLFNAQRVRTSTRNGRQLLQGIYKIVSKDLTEKQREEIAGQLDAILQENKRLLIQPLNFRPIPEFTMELAKEEIERTANINASIHDIIDTMRERLSK